MLRMTGPDARCATFVDEESVGRDAFTVVAVVDSEVCSLTLETKNEFEIYQTVCKKFILFDYLFLLKLTWFDSVMRSLSLLSIIRHFMIIITVEFTVW